MVVTHKYLFCIIEWLFYFYSLLFKLQVALCGCIQILSALNLYDFQLQVDSPVSSCIWDRYQMGLMGAEH